MDEQNALPINQEAKRALEQAGERLDPTILHLLQVASWGLENLPVPDQYRGRMREVVDQLTGLEPEKAMALLLELGWNNPEEVLLDHEDLEGLDLEEAASEVIELLHAQMKRKVRDYPVASPLP